VERVNEGMNREVFRKEEQVLGEARTAVETAQDKGKPVASVFSSLVDEYGRLLRQSRRLVTMGDRMQQTLNSLNHDLAVGEQKYRGIFENVTEGIYRCEADGTMVEVNPAMAAMFGFHDSESFLASVRNFKSLFCSPEDYELYESLLRADDVWRYQVKTCGPESGTIWAEISASAMRGQDSGVTDGVVGVMADVTERKHMVEEMCRLARTDSLTGLFNRGYFMDLAARELARVQRNGGGLSLLIVDVDYFKAVNDTYGHDVGDKALITLSRILMNSVREVDVVGRFGGEEFVVLLPDAHRPDACRVADRILDHVRAAMIDASDGSFAMTVSVGLTSFEDDSDDLDSLVKYADIALYAAKKNGRDRVEVYRRSTCSCRQADCVEAGTAEGGRKQ